jgi:SAM-dependent methyltransferase
MKLLSDKYLEQIKKLHQQDQSWGNSALNWVDTIVDLIEKEKPETILDYGCGKGKLAESLRKVKDSFIVTEYDPAIPGKDISPDSYDMVIATDVLEHIEPEYLHSVLLYLQKLIKKVGFFNICLQPAKRYNFEDGTNAHRILKPKAWWLKKLSQYFKVEEHPGRKIKREVTVIVRPKDKNDLTIACCYWGNWCGEWGPEYVNKLYRTTKFYISQPHRFVCFTDQSEGIDENIEILPLQSPSYVDILPKMVVYRPDNGLSGRVIVIDLDIVIVDSLDDMVSYYGEFCCKHNYLKFHEPGGDMLGFEFGYGEKIWDVIKGRTEEIEQKTKGDEREVYKLLIDWQNIDTWQMLYPGQLVSYKLDILKNGLDKFPENARLVSFHGQPRPHELLHIDWIKKHWGDV